MRTRVGLFVIALVIGGCFGFWVGRQPTAGNVHEPHQTSSAPDPDSKLRSRSIDETPKELPPVPDGTSSAATAVRSSTYVPAASSAKWIKTTREIDRRYALLYRICALVPSERAQVRTLLTKQELIGDVLREMQGAGFNESEINARLAADRVDLARLESDLETQAPEIAQFINVFNSSPTAVETSTMLITAVDAASSPVDATVAEKVLLAAISAERTVPIPDWAVKLDLADRSALELDKTLGVIMEHNKMLIPALATSLGAEQMKAAMDCLGEQLVAIQTTVATKR